VRQERDRPKFILVRSAFEIFDQCLDLAKGFGGLVEFGEEFGEEFHKWLLAIGL
jgi:hypothetical protein